MNQTHEMRANTMRHQVTAIAQPLDGRPSSGLHGDRDVSKRMRDYLSEGCYVFDQRTPGVVHFHAPWMSAPIPLLDNEFEAVKDGIPEDRSVVLITAVSSTDLVHAVLSAGDEK